MYGIRKIKKFFEVAYATDMVKQEGLPEANFKTEWYKEPLYKDVLSTEIKKLKPKAIGLMSKKVEELFNSEFPEYRKNSPQGYSNSVTNTISAVQAFLQILNTGKTGKGNISPLIVEAQKKGLIDDDSFTKQIFDNIESIFAKERQETSIAHPKKGYATEQNARTILNLAMVFFQHCIQK